MWELCFNENYSSFFIKIQIAFEWVSPYEQRYKINVLSKRLFNM